ncbi:hypothetical protein NEOLEDRAFT_1154611 [Neolentinus lepideus HHB14362 ss-1]|uniref:Arrestin-like N-terminal domain-containing protein n=1 Tax=Neolentinus lepideus HHB14362 ss-1 TaxID=1314782 RepID=A0A165UMA9_9AGAM|nr:hypothetical protein NEOLEDRAFT_1154611 [Neolentinus lepideus HHB14362 ss-1]
MMRRSSSYSSVAPPPSYYPSSEAPTYSSEPSSSEQRLDFSGRRGRAIPTGRQFKRSHRITLILENQEEDALIPTYGRAATISGEVQVKRREDAKVLSVAIKLDCKLSLTVAEGFHTSFYLMSECFILWENDRSCTRSCPYVFSFDVPLPTQGRIGESTPPLSLPPSYDVAFDGVPGLYAKSVYTITVMLTESRPLGFLKRKRHLVTPFNYYPRSRPHRPILPHSIPFHSTLKIAPEEWSQVISQMESRTNSGIAPLDCHLFIPSVQIYSLSDTIPFYVQLRGPPPTLRAFLQPAPPPLPSTPFDFPSLPSLIPAKSDPTQMPTVRVFLYRQVTVAVRGQKAWRTAVLGEGKLRRVVRYEEDGQSQCSLDWDGEVRCKEDVAVGGFRVGPLVVKDFIVLSLVPPSPQTSPLLEHQHAHPIRLVTDSFTEILGPVANGFID